MLTRTALLVAVMLSLSACVSLPEIDPAPKPDPAPRTISDGQPRLYHIAMAGHPDRWLKDKPNRGIHHTIRTKGYQAYLDKEWEPLRDEFDELGLVLRHPFGCGPYTTIGKNREGRDRITSMRFDQVLLTEESGILPNGIDSFVETVTPIADRTIVYIGRPEADQSMDRWRDAMKPFLRSGVGIAFDAASSFDRQHAGYQVLRRIEGQGNTIFIEAVPDRDLTHLHDIPIYANTARIEFCSERPDAFLTRSEFDPRSVEFVLNSQKRGERITATQRYEMALALLRQGKRVAVGLHQMTEQQRRNLYRAAR